MNDTNDSGPIDAVLNGFRTELDLVRHGTHRWRCVRGRFPTNPTSPDRRILIWRGPAAVTRSLTVEMTLAAAMRSRNIAAEVLALDDRITATIQRDIHHGFPVTQWPTRTARSARVGFRLAAVAGLTLRSAADFTDQHELNDLRTRILRLPPTELRHFALENVDISRHASHSLVRYLRGEPIDLDRPDCLAAFREYIYSASICALVARRAVDTLAPDRVLMQHGFYAEWGPAFDLFLNHGIEVVRWGRGMNKQKLRLSVSTPDAPRYIQHCTERHWAQVQNATFTSTQREHLDQLMNARRSNPHQIFANAKSSSPEQSLFHRPRNRPLWGVFSHVHWDAVIFTEPMLFPSPREWLESSIERMRSVLDVDWVIKFHPAERLTKTRQGLWEDLKTQFRDLPPNITLLPPDSPISTYDLLAAVDGGITIRGTVGLELAQAGKPVILAGSAHYGGKGFTYDPGTQEEYFNLLDTASSIKSLDEEHRTAAKKYAYDFFVNRELELEGVRRGGSRVEFRSFSALQNGRMRQLELLSHKIAYADDFTNELT